MGFFVIVFIYFYLNASNSGSLGVILVTALPIQTVKSAELHRQPLTALTCFTLHGAMVTKNANDIR